MKWLLLVAYVLSVLYIHFRGKVRLPLRRQVVDHSTFMAPINAFMQLFSKAPRTPFIPVAELAELSRLQQNWQVIRAEAENLLALKKAGWEHFYLKWYNAIHPLARGLCPQTFALLQAVPSVKVASFVELPPGARLSPHRDPFAGWLRYHLGLATPNDERCFIEVDGQRYAWHDGQAMVFDETYIHWASNGSDNSRVVLLCDIERPMRFRWAQAVNHFLGRTLMTVVSSPKETGPQAGVAGRLVCFLHAMGGCRRRFKAWSMAAYNAARLSIAVAIAALMVYWL